MKALILGVVAALAVTAPAHAHVPPPSRDVGFVYDGCPGTLGGPEGCDVFHYDYAARSLMDSNLLAPFPEPVAWVETHVPPNDPGARYHQQGHSFNRFSLTPRERDWWLGGMERSRPWSPRVEERFAELYEGCALHSPEVPVRRHKRACRLFWQFARNDAAVASIDPDPSIAALQEQVRQWRDEALRLRNRFGKLCEAHTLECAGR